MGEIAWSKSRIASDLKTRDSNRRRSCDSKLRFETCDWRFVSNTPIQQNSEEPRAAIWVCDPKSLAIGDGRFCPLSWCSSPGIVCSKPRLPALNLSKKNQRFSLFDHGIGRRTVPKLMNNRPKSAQWWLVAPKATNRRLIATNRWLRATSRAESVTNSD